MTATPEHEYFVLTAGVSLAAVGVHAYAAARAAQLATNGFVPRGMLADRGMTEQHERELLEAGLLRLAGGGAVLVYCDPLTRAAAALEDRRQAERTRSSRRRKVARREETSRDSAESRDSAVDPQNAGKSGPGRSGTSHTRGRVRAAHTHPPLLNVVNSEGSEQLEDHTHTVARARDALAVAFDEVPEQELQAGIALARHRSVDPVLAALEAAAMAASPTWRTRSVGATMRVAVGKLAAAQPAGLESAACPGPGFEREREQLLELLAGEVDETERGLWLEPLRIHAIAYGGWELAAPPASLTWVARFDGPLERAAAAIAGRAVGVRVVGCECAAAAAQRRTA